MSFWDLTNAAVIDGGQAPTNAAAAVGDHGQMLQFLVDLANKTAGSSDPSTPTADANGSILERIAYLQAQITAKAGIIQHPRDWAGGAGYEYWLGPGDHGDLVGSMAAGNAGQLSGLEGFGWSTNTTMATAANSNASDLFGTVSAQGANALSAAGNSTMYSPEVFGGYAANWMASRFLGGTPTKLIMEYIGRFTATTGDLVHWLPGLGNAAATATADASGQAGVIVSDGSNFKLVSDNGSDVGAAIDTNWHLFRIEWGASLTEWMMDGAAQGTIATETGIWPRAMNTRRDAAGAAQFTGMRIWYEL